MPRPPRHVVSAAVAIAIATVVATVLFARSTGALQAGFWFEPVEYASARLGGALTAEDLRFIEDVARDEVQRAFAAFPVSFTGDRDARYSVHVVQHLAGRRSVAVAGAARAVAGFGGEGLVNFQLQAANAVIYARPSMPRSAILQAIGLGIGRSAVHEFAHVFLGSADFHDAQDRMTYEYAAVSRREQYYGELRWGRALPLLQRRFGKG